MVNCMGLMKVIIALLSIFTLINITSCSYHAKAIFNNDVRRKNNEYKLVWEDLFNESEINTENWNIEYNYDFIPNKELQVYLTKNVSIGKEPITGNSCLIITAKEDKYLDRSYSSGRINSSGKKEFMYGKLEASIKLPKTSNGLWPAFWMLGADDHEVGWPQCGEIDIMEMGIAEAYKDAAQERFNSGCIHWGKLDVENKHSYYFQLFVSDYSLQDENFHLYTLIWDENSIEMFLDLDKNPKSKPYFSVRIDDFRDGYYLGDYFRKPYYIIFNLAVGGVFPDIFDIDEVTALNENNNYEAKMYIDFVRFYQR